MSLGSQAQVLVCVWGGPIVEVQGTVGTDSSGCEMSPKGTVSGNVGHVHEWGRGVRCVSVTFIRGTESGV